MTINGALRSIAAAQRRSEREHQRQLRQQARAAKAQAKLDELSQAEWEFQEYEDRIESLTTAHHEASDPVDWQAIATADAPQEPSRSNRRETKAEAALTGYQPTFFQRLFGSDKKRRAELQEMVKVAVHMDSREHENEVTRHQHRLTEWGERVALAEAILSGDTAVYLHAIEEMNPLAEMLAMGCELGIEVPDAKTIEVTLRVESETVVPREIKSLTKTGKLSTKAMPQAKFFELYQDYVCGCALRAAREFFSFLPISRVIVNVEAGLLDPATGHVRPQTVLSVGMPRQTVEALNYTSVDPSEAMRQFTHRMGFKRSAGFHAIEPLKSTEYPIAG